MINFAQIPILSRSFSVEYQAILDAAEALGYTLPNSSIQVAQNAYLEKMKSSGYWYTRDLLYVFKTGDSSLSDFATINWITPGLYRITKVNSPTYSVDGYTGNSTSSYLDPGFNQLTNSVYYTRSSASRFSYITTAGSPEDTTNPIDGCAGTADNLMMGANTTVQRVNQSTTNLVSPIDLTGTGYKALDRPDSSTVIGYSETTKTTVTRTDNNIVNASKMILRANAQYGNTVISLYGFGSSMTETMHNTVRQDYLDYVSSL